MSCWIRLGLEPTQDLDAIRLAYRGQLPSHHPETDPEGFRALREAYEEALRLAREHESLSAPEADESTAEQPLHPAMAAFHALLDDPARRFNPSAWQQYIAELDELPLDELDDVSWKLLFSMRTCGPVSNHCVSLLAERLRWADQVLRLDNPQEAEGFLQGLRVPDPFDTALMSDWPAVLQIETLWYLRSMEYLFQYRPLFEFQQFASMHTCLKIPDDPQLIERLQTQLTLAGIPSQVCHAHWLARLQASPDDADLLYLLARQADALNAEQQALDCCLRLLREHRHPQAERWLIELCARHQPQRLPLLIQSFDRQTNPQTWATDLSDPLQGCPSQNPHTLMRWSEASRLGLGGFAATFIDWRLDGDDELPVLAWLLENQADAAMHRLYWHAWALQRGEAGLLQQIIEATPSDDSLDALILEGFQRQARQQLDWLYQSVVAGALTEYTDTDQSNLGLPDSLLAIEVHPACREWLRRVRGYSARALINLNQQFEMPRMFTVPFAMALQGQLAEQKILMPPMPAGEALWDWHRHQLFMLAMLSQPGRWLGMVSAQVAEELHYAEDHPFHALHRKLVLAQSSSEAGKGLLGWLDPSDPLQDLVAGRLLSFSSALQSDRLPSALQLYSCVQQEPGVFEDHPLGYLLLCAVLYHDRSLDTDQRARMRDRIDAVYQKGAWFEFMREGVIAGKVQLPSLPEIDALGTNSKLVNLALDALRSLVHDCKPPKTKVLKALQKGKDDPEQDPALRCAIMALLTWSERMLRNMEKYPAAPAWKFWKIHTRLSNKGYGLTLLAVLAWSMLPIVLPSVSFPLMALMTTGFGSLLTSAFVTIAMLRRLRDQDHGMPLLVTAMIASALIPFAPAALLLLKDEQLPNQYGPSPSHPDALKDGLQAVLRRLNGQ